MTSKSAPKSTFPVFVGMVIVGIMTCIADPLGRIPGYHGAWHTVARAAFAVLWMIVLVWVLPRVSTYAFGTGRMYDGVHEVDQGPC